MVDSGLKEELMISDICAISNGKQHITTCTIDVIQLSRRFSGRPEEYIPGNLIEFIWRRENKERTSLSRLSYFLWDETSIFISQLENLKLEAVALWRASGRGTTL